MIVPCQLYILMALIFHKPAVRQIKIHDFIFTKLTRSTFKFLQDSWSQGKLFSQMWPKFIFVKLSSCVCKSRYGINSNGNPQSNIFKASVTICHYFYIFFKFYWLNSCLHLLIKWHDNHNREDICIQVITWSIIIISKEELDHCMHIAMIVWWNIDAPSMTLII